MSLFKRGDTWWYRFGFRGQLIRESSKSKSKEVCRRLESAHRLKLELNQGGLVELTKPRKFVSAAKDYLKDREAHWAPKTPRHPH